MNARSHILWGKRWPNAIKTELQRPWGVCYIKYGN